VAAHWRGADSDSERRAEGPDGGKGPCIARVGGGGHAS
jgi:hypothetical protein